MLKEKLSVSVTEIKWKDIKLGESIGSGGYGEVYKGSWSNIDIAIKQLHLKNLPQHLVNDFIQETQIMAQCQFPNIVSLYGVCMEPGHYSIVMEYMPKGSLYSLLQTPENSLSWFQRYNIAIDIGKGIAFLHAKNIIHRDLKSLNILLDEQYRAKITDFGLSKIKLESSSTSTKTNKAGTVRWRAPETFKRGFSPSPSMDIYSYGMVLWEIAARKLPFEDAPDELTVISWIKDGEQENIPTDAPSTYTTLIKKTWSAPDKRPSASDIVQGLQETKPQEEIKSPIKPEKKIRRTQLAF